MKSVTACIDEAAALFDIEISESARRKLAQYSEEIVRWNHRVNLTGAKSPEDFAAGPLFDALTLVPVLARNTGTLVDIGSGGGLPGIPAAIVADLRSVTLVEPRAKRVAFLRHITALLELDVQIRASRDAVLDERWDAAVAQAVFPPREWASRAVRLLNPGGVFYMLCSESVDSEILMPGAVIQESRQFIRPAKAVPRFAYRIGYNPPEETTGNR